MKRFFNNLFDDGLPIDTHYRVGMRVIKTVASVTICLLIAWLIGSKDSLPIAAVASIVTMQATQRETLKIGLFRVLGTIIGGGFGILAVLVGLFLPHFTDGLFIIVIPIMLMLNLYLCNLLKLQDSCAISCVVTIIVAAHIITESSLGESLDFTFIRLRDTLIGVFVSTAVNMLPLRRKV